jgi:ribosomal protein S18 acetylase RimI-like enzyme
MADTFSTAEVHVASWQAVYRGLMPDSVLDKLSVPKRAEMWRQIIAEQQFQLLLAEVDGSIVGLVNFGSARDPDALPGLTGEILAIYVDPQCWNKGIGRRLLQAALSELKSSGFNEVTLWVLDSNLRARAFYERAGFSIDGATQNDVVGDNVQIQEVRYRRTL